MPYFWRLYLTELHAEVFNKHLLKTSAGRHRLLADEREALRQCLGSFARQKDSRFESLFDFSLLDEWDKLLEELVDSLRTLPQIAKQQDEKFFRVTDLHNFPSFFVLPPEPVKVLIFGSASTEGSSFSCFTRRVKPLTVARPQSRSFHLCGSSASSPPLTGGGCFLEC